MSLKRVIQQQLIFSWLVVLAVLAVLLFIVSPARGAYWLSDDGLFLRMSWEAAKGYGWDRMLPQSPSYLFHALWMKIGLIQYLHFRYLHYIFSFICVFIFFGGLIERPTRSFVYPATVLLGILVSINSIESPNSLVLNFFLLGTGLYFYALKTQQKFFKQLFFYCGAVFLAICGFMHAAAAIASVLLVLIMIWLVPKFRRLLFLTVFLCLLIGLWAWYINQIGLSSLLQTPAAHDISGLKLLHRIWLLFEFALKPLAFYCLSAYLCIYWLSKRRQGSTQLDPILIGMSLSWGVAFLACLSVVSYLLDWGWRFPGWRGILQVPGLIYYPLFFILFFIIHQNISQWHFKTLIDESMALKMQQKKQLISILGFILFPAALAVGSNTAIIQGLVFFAGPAAGLVIYLWSEWLSKSIDQHHRNQNGKKNEPQFLCWGSWRWFFLVWFILYAIFSLSYNHPSSRTVMDATLKTINHGPLHGVRETAQYQESMGQIDAIYQAEHCAQKTLLVMDYVPMLHYILGHAAPNELGVMRPMYYYPEEKIQKALSDTRGWCVIDLTGIETQEDIQKNGGDRREPLRQWIQQHGNKYDVVTPGPELIGKITIYVK